MKSGAEFYMIIPEEANILDDRFCDAVEFPFAYSDIESLEFVPRIDAGNQSLYNDFETAKKIVSDFTELASDINADRIVVREMAK